MRPSQRGEDHEFRGERGREGGRNRSATRQNAVAVMDPRGWGHEIGVKHSCGKRKNTVEYAVAVVVSETEPNQA